MKRIAYLLFAVVAVAGVVVHMAHASGHADGEAAPIFGIKIPPGYRDWRLISVAHEEGDLNDIRAILGNDTAIRAYREECFGLVAPTMGEVTGLLSSQARARTLFS